MRKVAQYIVLCATLCLSLLSCNIHEWPENPIPSVEVDLTLTFKTDMPELIRVDRASQFSTASADDYDVRYIVKAYPLAKDGTPIQNEVAGESWSKDNVNNLDEQKTILLPPGKFRLYVWVDYVDNGSLEDKFYTTNSDKGFSMVSLIMPQEKTSPANNHFRDLFIGEIDIEVPAMYELGLPHIKADIEMTRPLAMFQFITTDLDEFVMKVLEQRAQEAAARGVVLPESELLPSSVDLTEYKVSIVYNDFMPTAFDMFQKQPNYAENGISFDSYITPLGNNEALLGFDYTFVLDNKTEEGTHPRFSVLLYDKDNVLVSAVKDIHVPLERSKYTTITDKFMTQQASGGVSINPDFEDEHNIIIGDE